MNESASDQSGSVYVDVEQMEWQQTEHPGVTMKMLWRDERGESFTALFRMEPGARLPLHRHLGVEQTFVLEGSLVDETGTCTAGNYVWRHAGSTHSAHSPDGCLAIGIFQKPNKFLEGEGI
jgi:anti-sigma factor ChrR (cupin superfamily)